MIRHVRCPISESDKIMLARQVRAQYAERQISVDSRMSARDQTISTTEFETRLPYLCVTRQGGGLPRKRRDLHIVLRSVALLLDRSVNYAEPALNAALRRWLEEVGYNFRLDHVTLRRSLVDYCYVVRDPAGTRYRVAGDHDDLFDPMIESLDPVFIIEEAMARREAKRKAFLSSKRGQ